MFAITDRLDLLRDQWVQFAGDARARLLRLVVEPDDLTLFQAFLEKEGDDRLREVPDDFLELDTPFLERAGHGRALRATLWDQYLGGEAPAGRSPGSPAGDDVDALIAALVSFRAVYGPEDGVLAVWLNPRTVRHTPSYEGWLATLADRAPSGIRFVVLDTGRAFQALARAAPVVVRSVDGGLDLAGAMREVSEAAGAAHTPEGQVRQLVVEIGEAARRQDADAAARLARVAAAVADETGLVHLVYVARYMLGIVQLATAREMEAARSFAQADEVATRLPGALGRQLRVRARVARGNALVKLEAYRHAAELFTDTAPLADGSPAAELDCWRLASYCHGRCGQVQAAWDTAMAGLRLASRLDLETRRTTSLPQLCEQTLALVSRRRPLGHHRKALEAQIVLLLGPSWRPGLEAAPPATHRVRPSDN